MNLLTIVLGAGRTRPAVTRRPPPGPETLYAKVRGDTMPELEEAAIREARDLYGERAELSIAGQEAVHTAWDPREGRYFTTIEVRCVNYAGLLDRTPAGDE